MTVKAKFASFLGFGHAVEVTSVVTCVLQRVRCSFRLCQHQNCNCSFGHIVLCILRAWAWRCGGIAVVLVGGLALDSGLGSCVNDDDSCVKCTFIVHRKRKGAMPMFPIFCVIV